MKRTILATFFSVFCLCVVCLPIIVLATGIILNNTPTQVFFSSYGGCTDAIVNQINNAKSEVLIQAYSFTSKEIALAIVGARKRGLQVEIILDRTNRSAKYSAADYTAHIGITSYIDSMHPIAHNKIIIIDGETVITGSFNFTRAAEKSNAENLLIIKNRDLAKVFLDNWMKHKEHSQGYEGK
ncbi:MAG: phospholipase D family protein [Syntrophales bacterium]|jgi:phosphatidylserine/phosphatidylglycerophosphate/cardiolipin synthase-like enzyme